MLFRRKTEPLLSVLQHVKAVHKTDLVAAHEGSFAFGNQIRGFDRLGAKAQVGYREQCQTSWVVIEVALGKILSLIANNLNGVFVRANRTVGAQTKEHCLDDVVAKRFEKLGS